MDSIWIFIITAIAIVAVAATISALVGGRAPRVPPDAERLALLRDRVADDRARERADASDVRVAQEREARTAAPQRRLGAERVTAERLWAGGL
jgi:hypothetical protein